MDAEFSSPLPKQQRTVLRRLRKSDTHPGAPGLRLTRDTRRTGRLPGCVVLFFGVLSSIAALAQGTTPVVVGSTVLTATGQNTRPMTIPVSNAATPSVPQIVTAPDAPNPSQVSPPAQRPAAQSAAIPRNSTPTLPVVLERPVEPIRPTPVAGAVANPQRAPQQTGQAGRSKSPLLSGNGIPNSPEAHVSYALTLASRGQHESAMAICNQLLAIETLTRVQLDLVRSCINFDVPLVRLRALMTAGQMASAQALLNSMLRSTAPDSERRRYLQSVRQSTASAKATDSPANPADAVLAEVSRILQSWRTENGYFPRTYAELNTVLPADAPPLVEYDIINYAGTRNEFSVAIRNRAEPREVLSLRKTGLLR